MKNSFLLLFLLPMIAFGQLRGEYVSEVSRPEIRVGFFSHNRFKYTEYTCTQSKRGYGVYKFNRVGGRLDLYFKTKPLAKESIQTHTSATQSDSIDIEISVFEKGSNKPMPAVASLYKGEDNGWVRDKESFEGKHNIRLARSSDSLSLHLRPIPYQGKSFKVSIVPNQDYQISVFFHKKSKRIFKSGEHKIFKIKNISPKSLELKLVDSWHRYLTFRRAGLLDKK